MHLNICDKPRADPGQTAFRVMTRFGWLKIGAKSQSDAMRQALRLTENPDKMEVWNGREFVPCM